MNSVSLYDYLMQRGRVLKKDIKIYGTMMGAVAPPSPVNTLELLTAETSFVVIDVVAVEHEGKFFWTHGKVITAASDYVLRDASSKPTKRLALSVSGGQLKVAGNGDLVAYYKFTKNNNNGTWGLAKCFTESLNKTKHAPIIEVISSGLRNNWEKYDFPVSMDVPEASSTINFEFLGQWAEWVANPPQPSLQKTAVNGATGQPLSSEQHQLQTSIQNDNLVSHSSNIGLESPSNGQQTYNPLMQGMNYTGTGGIVKQNNFKPRLQSTLMRVDPTKKKPDYHRLEPEPYSKILEEFEESYMESINKMAEVLTRVDSYELPYNILEILRTGIATGLQRNITGYVGDVKTTRFMRDLIVDMIEDEYMARGEDKPSLELSDLNKELDLYAYDIAGAIVNVTKASCKTAKYVSAYRDEFMFRVLEALLGVRKGGYMPLANIRADDAEAYLKMIANNLYEVGLHKPTLKVEALTKLKMLMDVEMTDDMQKTRNAMKVHSWLIDNDNQALMSSTFHTLDFLRSNLKAGYTVTNHEFTTVVQATGNALSEKHLARVKAIFGEDIQGHEFSLPTDSTQWERGRGTYSLSEGVTVDRLIKDAIEVGVLTEMESPETGEKLYASTALMKKELYIYNKLYTMLEEPLLDLTEEQVNNYARQFEAIKDKELGLPEGTFKLEERQRQAPFLLNYRTGILTGGAGSGKTTTAEFLLFVILAELKNIEEENIFFAAPTGKAAQRLAEVVKRMAYTLHRLFGIGVGTHYSLYAEHNERPMNDIKVLLIDESSIKDTDLLYEVMLKLNEDTILYFLGDEDQLPPIGFGKPFASMLTFMPTVHLNVSKRAAKGSKITVNANRLIDPTDKAELEEDESFRIIQEKDADVGLALLKNLLVYHTSPEGYNTHLTEFFTPVTTVGQGLTPADIQIISPYSSSKTCKYTSKIVNKIAQEILNPQKNHQEILVSKAWERDPNPTQYRINDRVIHVNSNIATRRRYKAKGGGTFVMSESLGVFNGDLGVVKGFIPLERLNIEQGKVPDDNLTDDDKRLLKQIERQRANAESNPNYVDPMPIMFMAVEIEGVNNTGEIEKFIILYQYRELVRDGIFITINPQELKNVELAYCLTTHKLQGSQAKLVIFLLFPHGFKTDKPFISRNMLYTGVTRAQVGEYLLGDVYGVGSVVNHGRKYQANTTRKTLFDSI